MRIRFAYDDVVAPFETAALAVGRLDAALSGYPPLPAWTFWSQLDTARRHAEVDGRRGDLYRLSAFLHGLPLRVGATLSMAERGGEIAALAYAVELRSWTVQPDPGQQDLLDSGLAHLRQAGAGQPTLIGAWDCAAESSGTAAGPRSAPPCPSTSESAALRATR
jgi:hypothetical protein